VEVFLNVTDVSFSTLDGAARPEQDTDPIKPLWDWTCLWISICFPDVDKKFEHASVGASRCKRSVREVNNDPRLGFLLILLLGEADVFGELGCRRSGAQSLGRIVVFIFRMWI
jgi:hypothetical protein